MTKASGSASLTIMSSFVISYLAIIVTITLESSFVYAPVPFQFVTPLFSSLIITSSTPGFLVNIMTCIFMF